MTVFFQFLFLAATLRVEGNALRKKATALTMADVVSAVFSPSSDQNSQKESWMTHSSPYVLIQKRANASEDALRDDIDNSDIETEDVACTPENGCDERKDFPSAATAVPMLSLTEISRSESQNSHKSDMLRSRRVNATKGKKRKLQLRVQKKKRASQIHKILSNETSQSMALLELDSVGKKFQNFSAADLKFQNEMRNNTLYEASFVAPAVANAIGAIAEAAAIVDDHPAIKLPEAAKFELGDKLISDLVVGRPEDLNIMNDNLYKSRHIRDALKRLNKASKDMESAKTDFFKASLRELGSIADKEVRSEVQAMQNVLFEAEAAGGAAEQKLPIYSKAHIIKAIREAEFLWKK